MNRRFVCLEIQHKLEVYATLKRYKKDALIIRKGIRENIVNVN